MAGSAAGGAELFFERLCIAQHESGLEVLPVIRRQPAREHRLRAGGLSPRTLAFGGRADLLTPIRLRRVLRDYRPSVAVAWMSRAARAMPRGPWTVVGRLGGFYDLRHYRRCRHLVGNTVGIVDWIRAQGWPADRVHHLPNFATDFGRAVPARPRAIPAGAPLVLALGRLHRNKAFDVLIRAMRHAPEAHLLIAGEGPERHALQALADAEGVASRVHMPGWADDAGALMAAADLLVCPSRHEPLGNVVIEAFGAGVPVVAARSQGPCEIIRPGEDGVLVPLEDPDALGDAIARILRDRDTADMLAANARQRFDREFSAAPVLQRWHEFLEMAGSTPCAA
ncbi:glycosyltransferase [Rhizosaccharibacter radicis]|uniref:Glycosyltransferase n=1 Tax=Rhizosaccharibacter radicis TaxID=2782605 RepID=A0ABT1VY59_9PROT|nr:glycosyltransferase [Acetobacteraceae bacterium KSS12]